MTGRREPPGSGSCYSSWMPGQVPGTVVLRISHTSVQFSSPPAHRTGQRNSGRRDCAQVGGTSEAQTQRWLPLKGRFLSSMLCNSTLASKVRTPATAAPAVPAHRGTPRRLPRRTAGAVHAQLASTSLYPSRPEGIWEEPAP